MASRRNNDDIAKRTIYSSETEDKKVNMGHEACRYAGRTKAIDTY